MNNGIPQNEEIAELKCPECGSNVVGGEIKHGIFSEILNSLREIIQDVGETEILGERTEEEK